LQIPLINRGRVLGVLHVLRTKEIPFNPEDVDFLKEVSGQIAIAVENAAAFQEISELVEERRRAEQVLAVQNARLQLLLELSKRITSNLELREVLRSVSVATREIMHADAAGVAFFDKTSDKARIYAVDFPTAKGFVREELVVTPGLAFKRAWESSKPITLAANDRKELGSEIYELVVAEGLNAHCLIPLVSRDRPVGVLILARKGEGFTREDVDFLREASGQIAIAIENALAFHEISQLKDKLAQEKLYLEEEIRSEMNFENIIGNSPALKHVLELVETVAPSDSTVLLLGETGTGKELIARAIHDRSRRKDRTFVKLNCAAIPTGLLESELFGHEKGAFTGAITPKIGRMELADQGSLFLDEVGDIPIEIQPKLLRALQEREFERLGSTHTRTVNLRLIAATNRDLEKMIADREFRSDLYYRLHVFPIRIPPLRERKEDIPQLISYFVQKFAKQMQKKIDAISPSVMKGFMAWDWPGNIRELENFIERAVILTRGKSLDAPLSELKQCPRQSSDRPAQDDIARIVRETIRTISGDGDNFADEYSSQQREKIVHALTESKGRVGGPDGAAARLGINRTTLFSRMKRFRIDRREFAA
jgi:formate hydrogenlyase transcriptional activator